MSTQRISDRGAGHDPGGADPNLPEAPIPDVEVRRNAGLSALVAAAATALALAFLARAVGSGGALDWVLGVILGGIGVTQLVALVDSRTPLLVADGLGIRLRLGTEWRGLPWTAVEQVVVEPRTSLVHDGRLLVAPRHLNRALEGLDARARRQVSFNEKVYGAPLVVPLGLTTRVSSPDLVADIAALADSRSAVVELAGYVAEPVMPETPRQQARRERLRSREIVAGAGGELTAPHELRGLRLLGGLGTLISRFGSGRTRDIDTEEHAPESPERPVMPSRVLSPAPLLRDPRPAARIDVQLDAPTQGSAALRLDHGESVQLRSGLPEEHELRRHEEDWHIRAQADLAGHGVVPLARPGLVVEPLVIDDFATEPALAPVIGPRVAAARTRLGFDVETLSDRTRIRPHVIEAIEVDDFEPCGGDFYARGHLRSLARVLGLPPEELVAEFDARYASAPINARRVFEAELASGVSGGIRTTFGGPRWSLMIGIVLVLILAWGLARLFAGDPQEIDSPTSTISTSSAVTPEREPVTSVLGTPVKMSVKATRAESDVQVRDHTGRILYSGHLKLGQRHQVFGTGPFTVRAANPGAVDIWVAGKAQGSVGVGDQIGRRTVG